MPEQTGIITRQAKNTNELRNNKFRFELFKMPETSWKCVGANIPGTSLPIAWQKTRFNPIPHSGLTIEFEPLEIEFLIDEDMNSYLEMTNWMRGMAMPIDATGYKNLKIQDMELSPDGRLVSDALLTILTNSSVPNLYVEFKDVFPIRLTNTKFQNTVDSPETQTCTATFAYTWFDIETVNDSAKGSE